MQSVRSDRCARSGRFGGGCGLLPERLSGVAPTITALREVLSTERVLVVVRCIVEQHLGALPTPLGFRHRARA
jgi:hypothetical protein